MHMSKTAVSPPTQFLCSQWKMMEEEKQQAVRAREDAKQQDYKN
jgi:hypothetical protein